MRLHRVLLGLCADRGHFQLHPVHRGLSHLFECGPQHLHFLPRWTVPQRWGLQSVRFVLQDLFSCEYLLFLFYRFPAGEQRVLRYSCWLRVAGLCDYLFWVFFWVLPHLWKRWLRGGYYLQRHFFLQDL